ncbi:MAG: Bax inhibitor-1/YccA family protein [Actinomycetota bacterium]
MQHNNPVFSRMPEFTRGGYATFDARPGQPAQAGAAGTAATDAVSAQRLEEMYAQPSAGPLQTGRMTYDDVVMKTAALFGVLVVAAGLTWVLAPGLFVVGMIGGLVLGLVNAFKREPSPALILAYAAFQGVFLGGISAVFEAQWNGIVAQAVVATLGTFGVMLALYKSGKIRVTPKFQRIMLFAVGGYMIFVLVNLAFALFAGESLRGFGPLGLLIGAVGAVLAALMLTLDFDFIDKGVQQGIPAKFAWTAAFGLAVTLIWLYVEFLRILAILRGDE